MRRKKEEGRRNIRVALTQSAGKLRGLEQALHKRGFEVVRSPLIKTETILADEVRARAKKLLDCPWLLFTSPSGVEAWGALKLPFDQSHIGTVGQKTAAAVEQLGGEMSLIGEPQNAAGLAEAFLQSSSAASPVGLPRGDRALPTLQDELEAGGFETRPVVVYRTLQLGWTAGEVNIVVLSSPSAVEALPQRVGKTAKLIALGPSTGAAISEYGWSYVQAESPAVEAILMALEGLERV